MTTISKAIELAAQGDNYRIKGRLVAKQIFFTRRNGQLGRLLILVVADKDGNQIEVKSWSDKQVYTVFRRFQPNEFVEIAGSASTREPNRKYSLAKCEIYSRWFLSPIDEFKLQTGIKCFSKIAKYHMTGLRPANIVGSYVELVDGPCRKNASGNILVQGYYLRLLDESCNLFQVLIWINPKLERANKTSVTNCSRDDVILILAAREQEERYRNKTSNYYTLTTTYPAVVNPTCVSSQVYLQLKKGRQSMQSERCIRFNPNDAA